MTSNPEHPLFHDLGGAEVQRLTFERGDTGQNHVVTLTLRRGEIVRAFRFEGVADIRLDGFPSVGWLLVHDVSMRQLDGLGVHVSDGEQSKAIEFWAASVKEIEPRTR
jgi:hypothetical protein